MKNTFDDLFGVLSNNTNNLKKRMIMAKKHALSLPTKEQYVAYLANEFNAILRSL